MKRIDVQAFGKDAAIEEAVRVLRSGGIIIYPTETTYGIGVDCQNPAAVEKLLTYKGKRDGKPISVAVTDQSMAERYVVINETAQHLYDEFLPGPVTVVSKGTGKTAPGISSPQGNVGIRIPDHPLALELIRTYGSGITATGANTSGEKRPYAVDDILTRASQAALSMIDLVLDIGELPHNEPSTVIDTTLDDVQILRAGSIQLLNSEHFLSHSVDESIAYARSLIQRYRSYFTYRPIILSLSGDMGAGKTHLVKGIAQGLGIRDTITSPTYTLCHEYQFKSEGQTAPFLHIDTWKMIDIHELEEILPQKTLQQRPIIAVEWGDRVIGALQDISPEAIILSLQIRVVSDTEREFLLSVGGLS